MFWPWQIVANFLSLNFTYKLDFQCEVSLLLCVFEEGETLDGIIDWTERDYNYYDLKSGSRDPSDESHGYFEEMKGDVKPL